MNTFTALPTRTMAAARQRPPEGCQPRVGRKLSRKAAPELRRDALRAARQLREPSRAPGNPRRQQGKARPEERPRAAVSLPTGRGAPGASQPQPRARALCRCHDPPGHPAAAGRQGKRAQDLFAVLSFHAATRNISSQRAALPGRTGPGTAVSRAGPGASITAGCRLGAESIAPPFVLPHCFCGRQLERTAVLVSLFAHTITYDLIKPRSLAELSAQHRSSRAAHRLRHKKRAALRSQRGSAPPRAAPALRPPEEPGAHGGG